MLQTDVTPFDLYGPLPGHGITVLEASAGTGKTFTIAALVTRLIAEEALPIQEILAVTFTRMATAELRDRIRARLVLAEERLGRLVDHGVAPAADDELTCWLSKADPTEIAARRRRLTDALAVFDAATITTTHGFCQLVLAGLGVLGGVGVGATLIEDAVDTVDETVDDVFAERVLRWGTPAFGIRAGRDIARVAVANPDTPLEPELGWSPAGRQRRFADLVRTEVRRRLVDANLLTYDDLLVRLKETLADSERGEAACARLRDRYRVVLVDEFQDTDPIQWEVVRRAFGTGATRLILIGDPKQAIYAFRGADVYAYLDAARQADHRFTLSTNWRSDAPLLAAYDALLVPLHVGHPEITYRPVTAAPIHTRPGLQGAPITQPLRARVLYTADRLVTRTKSGYMQADAARRWVADDVAHDIVGLLASRAELVGPDDGTKRRRITRGDVAVLVRTNHQAGVVQHALREAGVAAVVSGTENVFSTPSAKNWLSLLEGLEQPASRSRAASVALTPFIGSTANELAAADEGRWESVHAQLHLWADILRRRGVATLFKSMVAFQSLPARLLKVQGGERELTDLGHVAQLLHAEGSTGQLGAPALRSWLSRRIEEVLLDTAEAEERSRRLDSDSDAVQVLTVHRAKGLEFPVVYCPYLWDPGGSRGKGRPVVFHDPDQGLRRTLDVGIADEPASYLRHLAMAHEEESGEDLRHLYVALTRARHQAVIWWVGGWHSEKSPLGRLLMFRDDAGNVQPSGKYTPKDANVEQRLHEIAAKSGGLVSVERCEAFSPQRWQDVAAPEAELELARFERRLDLAWRRTSYTGITSSAHDEDENVGSEADESGTVDEPPGAPPSPVRPVPGADESVLRRVPSLLAAMPGGREVGTLVHSVLEQVEFSSSDLADQISQLVESERTRRLIDIGPIDEVTAGLVAALSTPLGPLVEGRSLAEIDRADRLDELGFELPLAGGDDSTGEVSMRDIATLLSDHLEQGTVLRGYPARLASPTLASQLRGYLTGSLDLVFRTQGPGKDPRFFVVDYKTNWLGPDGETLSAWHYRPEALEAEMQRAHYPLQAVLYLVALHRYLRWRLPGYDPLTHLGGVLYLFVRGMTGPGTPTVGGSPCGVFSWKPAPTLVSGLSDLFDSGALPR